MILYNVFSSCVYYEYKAYICSKATVVLVITSVLAVVFPIISTYRSHGFFINTHTYQEQPIANFKYDYIILFDVSRPSSNKIVRDTFTCSSLKKEVKTSAGYDYCPLIKAYEEDLNADGYKDFLHFKTKLFLQPEEEVTGISFMLLFDYRLSKYCQAQFEGAAFMQHLAPMPGAGIEINADLALFQRQPLSPSYFDIRYNETIILWEGKTRRGKPMDMGDVLLDYSRRNISTRLKNIYKSWIPKIVGSEPFTMDLNINYAEVIVRYTPTTWQRIRHAWTQLFPLLAVFVYIFEHIKEFIFTNQLVNTIREQPWKKRHL